MKRGQERDKPRKRRPCEEEESRVERRYLFNEPIQSWGCGFLSNCHWFLRLIQGIWISWRFYSRPRGEKDKEKSRPWSREYPCVFNKKLVTWLLPLRFPPPLFLVPLVLCAEQSDEKANWESRSVDRGCRGTKPERFSSVHGDICIPSIAFEKMFIASSSVKRISSRQRAIFLSMCAKSRPVFFVISESGWAKWIARTSCGPAGLLKWMNLSDGFMWSFETRCP